MQLILASQSPARRLLLEKLGVPFVCVTSGYHEDMSVHDDPMELGRFLASGKANFVAKDFPESVILGADTFVMNGDVKIGKPATHEEAMEIVRNMSGKVIDVYTGVCVVRTDAYGRVMRELADCVLTRLHIRVMSEDDVRSLAYQPNALEISGAFSIEGAGGKMVTKIEGDYDNVIGLPVFRVKEMLSEIGTR
jgi:septum formation protein